MTWWLLALCPTFAAPAPSVQALLDEAVRAKAPRLLLPAGVLRVERNLTLNNATDLVIEGPQTTLLFAPQSGVGLHVYHCRNLTLRGFTFDYDPLPFVQGSITARADDGTWFDVEVHEGYPGLRTDDQTLLRQAYLFEADRPRWKRPVPDLYPRRVEIRDERHGRMVFGGPPAYQERIQVGDRVVFTKRNGGAIRMDDCEDVRFEDLTFLAAPGAAVLGRYMRGDNYFRYDIKPGPTPPGATQPRLMSTCADGFNIAFATKGPTLEDSHFSFMGDDSVNLHGVTLAVLRCVSPTEILAAWPYAPESLATVVLPGFTARRLKQGTFEILGQAPLTSFTAEKQFSAEDLAAIQKIWPRNEPGRGTVWRLKLDQPLEAEPGELIDIPESNAPGYVIRNCTFADHRARGLRLMAGHGLIEHNTIRRTKMVAISVGCEYGYWREAGWVEDVIIRDNLIEDVCHEAACWSPRCYTLGAISIFAQLDSGVTGPYPPGNRGIVIEHNRITGSGSAGIYVAAARDVTVRGNRVERVLYHLADDAGSQVGLDLKDPIDLRHATEVQAADNTVVDLGTSPPD